MNILNHFVFLEQNRNLDTAIQAQYDPSLVFLSVLLAIFSSYIAFLVSRRIRSSEQHKYNLLWLWVGALALGSGIWAMHFVGMLAYILPVAVNYDITTTIISVIPAILSSLIVLKTSHGKNITAQSIFWRSVLMGSGIGLMHYTGMAAMNMNGVMRYEPWLFIFSILIAVVLAGISLQFKLQADKYVTGSVIFSVKLLIPAVIMGCAISAMHYIGMAALYVFPDSVDHLLTSAWSSDDLAKVIGIITVLLGVLLLVAIEVSNRLDLYQKIKESEQDLAVTLNSIGDAVITTDVSGLVTRMNPVAEQLTGWSFEEAQSQSVKTIFPIINVSTGESIVNLIEKVITTGETIHFSNHTTLIAKDGTKYQITDSAAPIHNVDGDIQGMVLVFNDVTEQYQLREAANKSRRDLQAIMNNSPAVIYVKDTNGRFTFINQQFENLFQIQMEDIIGKTLHDVFPKNIADEMQRNDKAVLEAGHALESEEIAPHSDGSHTYTSIKFPLFNEDGNIYAVCGISTDITDKIKSEEALSKSLKEWTFAMDYFEDAIYLIDLDDKLIRANRTFYNMTGLTPETAVGYDITTIIHPEGEEIPCPVCKARKERRDEVIIMEADHPDNPAGRPIQITVQIIRDKEGSPLSVLMGIRDLSNLRAAEEENAKLQHQLHQSQKMDALGKLTGGIAHDYNNMLGVVLGYAELLETELSEQPKLAKYVHEIHHASERGAKLTKSLLAFSRVKPAEPARLNLNALLRNEQHMLEKTLTVRIKLVLDLAQDLWAVWLDDSDMEDAILNISINAMHAIEGNGQLTIRTSNEQINQMDAQLLGLTPGDYILLGITDTGCGMDKETRDKIFEPFFSTKGEKGTGLGLSQVYGFVHRSGGAIKVYSEPGHGTRFAIYFPRYYESGRKEQPVEENNVADIKGTETILVVDDEPALLSLSCEILSLHGYNVFAAENAKKALDILEHEIVDLLISDIIMPEMDGYQLAAIVKEKYPTIKIQLASGFSDDRNIGMADESLQQNLLHKPFNSQVLLQRIRDLLNKKE